MPVGSRAWHNLRITIKIVAKCPGGDVLSSSRTRIAVTSSGQNVASAIFDLSTNPIVIGPDSSGSNDPPSVTHEFHFPIGTFWRIPVSTHEVPTNGVSSQGEVDLDPTTLLIDCVETGSTNKSGQTGGASNDSNSSTAIGADNWPTWWVAQLSSKRPGLVADGITWNNADTLREHLDLRLKYPEVRLLWSGDWSTISEPDFWITIAGVTFPDAAGALRWSRDHGLDREHCYAKLVSTTHPIDGSTAFNR